MNKKLGPLKLWQWAAIGAALGLVIYLYERNHSSSSSSSDSGAIDPATGEPYAEELSAAEANDSYDGSGGYQGSGGGGGGSTTDSGTNDLGAVEDWQNLESALSNAGYLTLQIDPNSVSAADPNGLSYAEEYEFANGGWTQANSDIGTIQGDYTSLTGLFSTEQGNEGALTSALSGATTNFASAISALASAPAPTFVIQNAPAAPAAVSNPVAPQQAGGAIASSDHSARSAGTNAVPGSSVTTSQKNGKTTTKVRDSSNNFGGLRD